VHALVTVGQWSGPPHCPRDGLPLPVLLQVPPEAVQAFATSYAALNSEKDQRQHIKQLVAQAGSDEVRDGLGTEVTEVTEVRDGPGWGAVWVQDSGRSGRQAGWLLAHHSCAEARQTLP